MATISTHVLDTARGRPAAGMTVALFKGDNEAYSSVGTWTTNDDGRVTDGINVAFGPGEWLMQFDTRAYMAQLDQPCFYPHVLVHFTVTEDDADEHFHIPLLVSPYGYSTYRGS